MLFLISVESVTSENLMKALMADNIEWLLHVEAGNRIFACADCATYWVNVAACWLCGEPGIELSPEKR